MNKYILILSIFFISCAENIDDKIVDRTKLSTITINKKNNNNRIKLDRNIKDHQIILDKKINIKEDELERLENIDRALLLKEKNTKELNNKDILLEKELEELEELDGNHIEKQEINLAEEEELEELERNSNKLINTERLNESYMRKNENKIVTFSSTYREISTTSAETSAEAYECGPNDTVLLNWALTWPQTIEACYCHDFCYRYGKQTYNYDRVSDCDNQFWLNLVEVCNDYPWWAFLMYGPCLTRASTYYAFVMVSGGLYYSDADYYPYRMFHTQCGSGGTDTEITNYRNSHGAYGFDNYKFLLNNWGELPNE